MYWVDPKDHMLKVLCQYIHYWLRYRVNQEKRPIVIRPTHPKLTQVPRVIHDILDVVGRPQGSYAESYLSLSLFLTEYKHMSRLSQNVTTHTEDRQII